MSHERLKSKYKQFVEEVGFKEWYEYGRYLIWRDYAKKCGSDYDDFYKLENWNYGAYHHMKMDYGARYKKWKESAPNSDDFRYWCEWIQWMPKKQKYDNDSTYTCPRCNGKGCLKK